jgi:CelD/BcsL family acetyltransferase involved in cellulose biosynthesis
MTAIVRVQPQDDPRWQTLLTRAGSSVFHSPEWFRVLAETYDFDVSAHIILDPAGQPAAGLAFVPVTDVWRSRIVSLPFSDYCDPLVQDHRQWRALVEPLLASGHGFSLRCLHNDVPLGDEQFNVVNKARWHGLDLQPDLDTLWSGFNGSARRAIKKAQEAGVTIRIAEGKADLRAFFEMHLSVRKNKYRLLAQPYRFFEAIRQHFLDDDKGALMVATYQGEIIAAIMFLEWRNTLYYKFNASHAGQLAVRPTDMLIWEGIKYGKDRGMTHLDFGLSDWDQEGLVRFKRKFATEEKTISFLQYAQQPQPHNPDEPGRRVLPQLTNLLTGESVPDDVTEKAGELLYRFFA